MQAIMLEGIAHHGRQNVGQGARQLKHDDHHRDGDVHDAAQCSGRTEKGISARGDAGHIGLATRKESGIRHVLVKRLHQDAHQPAEGGANGHGRHKDTGRYFAAI